MLDYPECSDLGLEKTTLAKVESKNQRAKIRIYKHLASYPITTELMSSILHVY